jgi:hypothetical protein
MSTVGGKKLPSRLLDERTHLRACLAMNERPGLHAVGEAISQPSRADAGREPFRERGLRGLVHENPVGGHAHLPRDQQLEPRKLVGDEIEVGVGQDDEGGVAAELER